MIHQQRTPLQRFLSNIKLALLVSCLLAVPIFARPLTSEKSADTLLQLLSSSSNNALAPKSTENKREFENEAAAPGPLSPEHERARQLWNKAKKLHHQLKPRRYVRNVNYVRRNAQVDNHNVSKYILELYKNMTDQNNTGSRQQQDTQANTVRSLQTINSDNTPCGVFNFSLSSINRSEYIVDAELRFSLVLSDKTLSNSNVYVTIHSLNDSDSLSEIQSNIEITAEDNPKHIHVFKVAGKILPWVQEGARYAEFQVQFFSNYKTTEGPLSCDKIHFYNGNNDEDTEPLLVVHSYDSDLDKIDYARILDTVKQNNTAAAETNKRSTRQTEQEKIPFCNVLPLEVQGHEIPKKDGNEEILAPSTYNAGICGGNCGTTMPQNQDLGHNVLIHMLQGSSEFRERHGHTITRCCAPIKYEPLKMIVLPPAATTVAESAYIRILKNMMIAECECIEIVDFTNVTKRN